MQESLGSWGQRIEMHGTSGEETINGIENRPPVGEVCVALDASRGARKQVLRR